MENATKALMIAAAILVAILVISLGIGIFNNASEQAEGAGDLSEYQIQTHNDKFTKYAGSNVTGAEVNSLLTTVFNHNIAQPDNSTCVAITSTADNLTSITASNALTGAPTKVSTGGRYTVTITYSTVNKLVNSINVEQN